MNTVNQNNINSKPIGFFDSGVGGLSVYAKFREKMPNENTYYFGDLIHLPYGNKSKDELVSYAKNILDFFNTKEVKAVVIACNTSSAQAYDAIKNDYNFKIYPIIQSCASVISQLPLKKIGIFATQATVNSKVYTQELKKHRPDLEVFEIACPDWVEIVESGGVGSERSLKNIKKHLDEMMSFNPDKIILGCTHYPYLLNDIEKLAPKNLFIDPADIFVEYISQDMTEQKNNQSNNGFEEFYVSAEPENFVNNAKLFYNVKKLPQVI